MCIGSIQQIYSFLQKTLNRSKWNLLSCLFLFSESASQQQGEHDLILDKLTLVLVFFNPQYTIQGQTVNLTAPWSQALLSILWLLVWHFQYNLFHLAGSFSADCLYFITSLFVKQPFLMVVIQVWSGNTTEQKERCFTSMNIPQFAFEDEFTVVGLWIQIFL